ncbi:MAG: restriction endonuclease subunit S [Betaproteobacteria bacterium]|nr:restriction endonuclease subunit S [Betaproteobacteria bacterium]
MAGEWKSQPLSSLLAEGRGISYGIVQPGTHLKNGVPIVRVADIRGGRIATDQPMRVAPEIEAAYARTRLNGGELLLTLVGTVGEAAVVPPEMKGWNVARAVAVIPVREDVGAYWIKLALNAPEAREMIFGRLNTTVQATLNLKDVAQLPILLPDEGERERIAHILGTLDDKIELNRRMNETLEAIARAIFKSWFVDFDPVRAKASGEPPESICRRLRLTPDLLALFPDRLVDSELGEIPEGWEVSTLGEHIEIFDSKRIPLSNREREVRRGQYPYYGAASVMDYVDDYIFDGIYVLMGEDGSVVNEYGSPVIQYVWGKFWVNNHAHVLLAKTPMASEHLLLLLKRANIAPFVTGAVQAKLSQGNLRRIPLVSASARVVEEFAKLIVPFFDLMRSREEETRTLANARDALLPKLLSGELRVKDDKADVAMKEVAHG